MAEPGKLEWDISTEGGVPPEASEYARGKIAAAVAITREPVTFVEVRLTEAANPAYDRPARAEASLDVNGRPVRAHVAAGDIYEAIDLLEDRLTRRVRRHEDQVHHAGKDRRRRRDRDDHEWRHGDAPTHRPDYFDRPPDQRELVRRKAFNLHPLTVDEAAFDLDMLGHDFYVFNELATGADSILSYGEGEALGLQQPEGTEGDPTADATVPVTRRPAAPELSIDEAIERLDAGGERFVFFVDRDAGRGAVVYHRYDGHYGLVTAA